MQHAETTLPPPLVNRAESRPRPNVRPVDHAEVAWDPVAVPQFTLLQGEAVRSGDSYAIVRPGMQRWPLGHVSGVYRVTPHRETVEQLTQACGSALEQRWRPIVCGHGYRVAHSFAVSALAGESHAVDGFAVGSRLVLVHDHTGKNALRARMVVHLGEETLGSVVGARAVHVAGEPRRWRVEVERATESSQNAQRALLELLRAAAACAIGPAEEALLTTLGVKPAGGFESTLLRTMVSYHRARQGAQTTWGVWQRRLGDDAVVAMCRLLGRGHGEALDEALGTRRYSAR